ncbi:hypothetical protein [Rheinheimera maricola]|uniref:Uncharacterized protein n=1 Tax=Rheinheimera maricola TaxID=2793282 RepID=A0ABS7X7G4_9GAMM|nr:hypothetical protein [Rheinheimera maricola]MBZ9610737.1 hypothetical protein [Rheinheimera maricola]
MKDAISIHDYLFDIADIGDWEGDEELVTDKINSVYHAVWQALPENISVAKIEHLLPGIWDQLRGGTVLLEADEDELVDWALAYVRQQLEEGIPDSDTVNEEE